MLNYYDSLFRYEAPELSDQTPIIFKVDETGVTHLIVKARRFKNMQNIYDTDGMKCLFNEYINAILMKEFTELPPFSMGTEIYDTVDCLYVFNVSYRNEYYYFDIIYVDSPLAFHEVRADQKKGGGIYGI
jgi:hypothetical protein